MYFDLETSGLGPDCEILQLAMIDEFGREFNEYAMPERPIDDGASKVTRLTLSANRDVLLYDGKAVEALSLSALLESAIEFLRHYTEKVVLIAHNCFNFDAPVLKRALLQHGVYENFCDINVKFADSYRMMWCKFPALRYRKGTLKLTNIIANMTCDTSELLSTAHNAMSDTLMLKILCEKYFTNAEICKSSQPIELL